MERGTGLIVLPENFISDHSRIIASLALRHGLAAIGPFRLFPSFGGLISYGVHPLDNFQRAPAYVDRLLKGEPPSNLPVQLPTKFEIVINAKTATALGLTVPPSMLALADEVIE